MKKLDLNALGVEEMEMNEVLIIDGGVGPGSDISGSTYQEDQAILGGMWDMFKKHYSDIITVLSWAL